jgi:hypothetical protein
MAPSLHLRAVAHVGRQLGDDLLARLDAADDRDLPSSGSPACTRRSSSAPAVATNTCLSVPSARTALAGTAGSVCSPSASARGHEHPGRSSWLSLVNTASTIASRLWRRTDGPT